VFHKLQFSENQADSTSTEVSRFILGRIQVNYTEAARLVRQSGCLFQHITGKFSLQDMYTTGICQLRNFSGYR
jgi:hypothetical protein